MTPTKEILLRKVRVAVVACSLLLTACAGSRTVADHPDGYVEIDNPAYTMSPGAPPTIWVPRSYVESGVPRGSVLLKEGYEKVVGSSETPQKRPVAQQGAKPFPQRAVTPISVKNRLAILEIGQNGLVHPFYSALKQTGAGVLLDPSQPAFLVKYATVTTQADRATFADRLEQDYGASLTVVIEAPDAVAAGKLLKGEIYDGMGGGLIRTVSAEIPQFASADPAAREAAVSAALASLAQQVRGVVALLPWYGKVEAVDGGRVYINAGREAGIKVGQQLKVYRGGKVVPGLGFAPGDQVATLEIEGFVGIDGAYGVAKGGKEVKKSDIVGTGE